VELRIVTGEKGKLVDLKILLMFLHVPTVSIVITCKNKITPTIIGFPFL
jgi:hypothetical protein